MREQEMEQELERALLVGVDTGEEEDFDHSIEELGSLAQQGFLCGTRQSGGDPGVRGAVRGGDHNI